MLSLNVARSPPHVLLSPLVPNGCRPVVLRGVRRALIHRTQRQRQTPTHSVLSKTLCTSGWRATSTRARTASDQRRAYPISTAAAASLPAPAAEAADPPPATGELTEAPSCWAREPSKRAAAPRCRVGWATRKPPLDDHGPGWARDRPRAPPTPRPAGPGRRRAQSGQASQAASEPAKPRPLEPPRGARRAARPRHGVRRRSSQTRWEQRRAPPLEGWGRRPSDGRRSRRTR